MKSLMAAWSVALSAAAGVAYGAAWTNGNTGNFNDSGNWSPQTVPTGLATNNVGGTICVGAGDTYALRGLFLGVNAGKTGKFSMTGGSLTFTDQLGFRLGDGTTGTGTGTMSGGELTVRQMQIGSNGPGEFTLSGGRITVLDWSCIGRYANGKGKMTIRGTGEVLCAKKDSQNSCIFVGEEGVGELIVEDGGKLTFSEDNGSCFVMPNNAKGRGTTWLKTGGTITTKELRIQAAGSLFVWDGGKLVSQRTDNGTFMGNKGAFQITDRGGEIDTGPGQCNIWISWDDAPGATGAGVIAKTGSGALYPHYSGTYSGGFDVKEGTLQLDGPYQFAGYRTATLTVESGAKLSLGKNWTDEQVAALKSNPNFTLADGESAMTRAAHEPTADIVFNAPEGYTINLAGQTFSTRVVKTGPGTLVIKSPCVFEGGVVVSNGVLEADWETSGLKDTHVTVAGGSAGAPAFLRVKGVGGTFAPTLGTSGNSLELKTYSGILPGDGPLDIDFFGDGRLVKAGSAGFGFTDLILNDRADWPVRLKNPFDLNGNGKTFKTRNLAPLYIDGGLTNSTGNGTLYLWDGSVVFPDIPGKTVDHYAYRINPRSGNVLFTNAVVKTSNDFIVGNGDASSGKALVTFKDCDKQSTGGWDYVNGSTGTVLTIDGGAYRANGRLNIGYQAAGRTGTLVITNGAQVTIGQDLNMWSGEIRQYGGKMSVAATTTSAFEIHIGYSETNKEGKAYGGVGPAKYVLYDGELYLPSGRNMQIGHKGDGFLWMLGGSVNCSAYPCVGRYPGGKGELRIDGGLFYHRKNTDNNNNLFFVSEEGTGVVSVANGGRLESEYVAGIQVSSKANSNGTLILSPGGTVTATRLSGSTGSRDCGVVFNGGTFVARADDRKTELLATSLRRVTVTPSGGAVDTNGKGDFTIPKVLTAATTAQDLSAALAHRWTFDGGTLVDAVAGKTATVSGTAAMTSLRNGIRLPGGKYGTCSVNLGTDLLPADGRGFTIETWFRVNTLKAWARLFNFGDHQKGGAEMYFAPLGNSNKMQVTIEGFNSMLGSALAANRDYYMSLAVDRRPDDMWEARYTLADAVTGEIIETMSMTKPVSSWSPANIRQANGCWLGHSGYVADYDPAVDYYDFRVHHRAMTAAQVAESVREGANRIFAFTKKGVGRLTLTGANSYACGTAVEQGTLDLADNATLPATEWVVAKDAVLQLNTTPQTAGALVGEGTVKSGAVTVTGDICPGGIDAVGTLTLDGTALSGGRLVIDLSGDGKSCDCLNATGELNLSGMSLCFGANGNKLDGNAVYTIATAQAVIGGFKSVELPKRWQVSVQGNRVVLSRNNGGMLIVR